jgi:hypothetical protein
MNVTSTRPLNWTAVKSAADWFCFDPLFDQRNHALSLCDRHRVGLVGPFRPRSHGSIQRHYHGFLNRSHEQSSGGYAARLLAASSPA